MGQIEDGDSSILVDDADKAQENNNEFDSSVAVKVLSSDSTTFSSIDTLVESTFHPVHVNGDHSSTSPVFHSESTSSGNDVDVSSSSNLITVDQESTYTLTSDRSTKNECEQETVSFQYSGESSTRGDVDVNGTDQVSETDEALHSEAPMVSKIHIVSVVKKRLKKKLERRP